MLHNLHRNALWPILFLIPAEPSLDEANYVTIKFQNYVLFVWKEHEADIVEDILLRQLEYLQDSTTWNSRAKFIVVVNTCDSEFTRSLALRICETLWIVAKIANVVVLIPSTGENFAVTKQEDTHREPVIPRLELYTFFPFQNGKCGEVKDVVLIDQCVHEADGSLLHNRNLYQTKSPQNFLGCPINVSSVGVEPYVFAADGIEPSSGESIPRPTGLAIEPIILIAEKINLTLIFLEPCFVPTLDSYWSRINTIHDGTSNIAIGAIPLISVVAQLCDYTIPYVFDSVAGIIPCPGRVPKADMIMNVYATSVWIALALAFILTAIAFWCTANFRYGPYMESYNFRLLSSCFNSAWAIFMGVSVSEMPRTSKLRILFLLYVCYCFAISTVFQAFFTSFLVESGYEEGFHSLEELFKSDLFYGYNTALEFLFSQFDFLDSRLFSIPRIECNDIAKCAERVIFERDMATIYSKLCVHYIGIKSGVNENSRMICFLEYPSVSGSGAAYLPKGSLFLDRINSVLRRYLEAGLMNRYWSLLTWGEGLKSSKKFDNSQDFVPFSVSHLTPAFKVVIFGHVLSLILFLAELSVNRIKNQRKRDRPNSISSRVTNNMS
jgi:hypothetical protein